MVEEDDKERHTRGDEARLTLYWIGWAFFAITLLSVFIAGILVSMYKVNVMDTRTNDMGLRNSNNVTKPKSFNVPKSRNLSTTTARFHPPVEVTTAYQEVSASDTEIVSKTDTPAT